MMNINFNPKWRQSLCIALILCGCHVVLVTSDTGLGTVIADGEMSTLCVNQTKQLDKAIKRKEDWALRIRDSNGRPGPGVLLHRLLWLGSYDQCLTTRYPASAPTPSLANPVWYGHYCLATITLQQFGSELTRVGLCFPDGCDGSDVKNYLEINGGFIGLEELKLSVKTVDHVTCQKRDVRWSSATVAILVLLCLLGAVVGFSTVYHVLVADRLTSKTKTGPSDLAKLLRDESASSSVSEYTMLLGRPITPGPTKRSLMRKLMTCFSLKSSWLRLIQSGHDQGQVESQGQGQGDGSPDVLPCLHGLRVIGMLWVIQGHTYYFAAKVPSSNLKEAWDKQKGGFIFQIVLNSVLAGDTFFFISGLLACYAFLNYREDHGTRRTLLRFFCRQFWRITPVYLLVILLMLFVAPHLGDGPLWSELTDQTNRCRANWWTNLLYVNNFVHTDHMCLEWSWFLANYAQFSAVAPVFIVTLHAVPAVGIFLCCTVVVVSSTLTGFIATHKGFGLNSAELGQLFSRSYMDDYLIKPYCRAPPYVIGILTGYLLYRAQCQMEINKVVQLLTSFILASCSLLVLFGTVGVANGGHISQPAASFYMAMSHVIWPLGIAWFVALSSTASAGWMSKILSRPAWCALSRLSLCVYLIHPVVILLHYLSTRTPLFVTPFTMVFFFIGHTILSYVAALVMYLGFQSPFVALQQLTKSV